MRRRGGARFDGPFDITHRRTLNAFIDERLRGIVEVRRPSPRPPAPSKEGLHPSREKPPRVQEASFELAFTDWTDAGTRAVWRRYQVVASGLEHWRASKPDEPGVWRTHAVWRVGRRSWWTLDVEVGEFSVAAKRFSLTPLPDAIRPVPAMRDGAERLLVPSAHLPSAADWIRVLSGAGHSCVWIDKAGRFARPEDVDMDEWDSELVVWPPDNVRRLVCARVRARRHDDDGLFLAVGVQGDKLLEAPMMAHLASLPGAVGVLGNVVLDGPTWMSECHRRWNRGVAEPPEPAPEPGATIHVLVPRSRRRDG